MAIISRTACAALRQQMSQNNARPLHTNITTTTSIDAHVQKGLINEWRHIWRELGGDQWLTRHGHIELPGKVHSGKSKRLPGSVTAELHIHRENPESSEEERSLMHLIKNLNTGMPKVYKPSFPEM